MKPVAALRGRVAGQVRDAIVAGTLAPGERVNESRLSAELGVSRTPLREALFSLEGIGLLHAEPPRGFFVAALSAREARELYPIGKSLDLLALRSARRFPKPMLDELERLNRTFAAAKADPERARLADRAFHRALTAGCPNGRLLIMLDGVQASLERYERAYMADRDDVARSARGHAAIVRALRGGDLETAIALVAETWDYSLDRLLLALGETP